MGTSFKMSKNKKTTTKKFRLLHSAHQVDSKSLVPRSLFTLLAHVWAHAPTSDRVHANTFSLTATVKIFFFFLLSTGCNTFSSQFWTGVSVDLDYAGRTVRRHFIVLFFTVVFSPHPLCCQGKCCNTVLLWSKRNILCTSKLDLTLHPHGDEKMMSECSFCGWT